MFLTLIFRIPYGFLKPEDNLADGLSIFAVETPDFFVNAIFTFYKCRVETPGRLVLVGSLFAGIEILHFPLGKPVVIIACGCLNEVFTVRLVDTFRKDLRIEDYRTNLVE